MRLKHLILASVVAVSALPANAAVIGNGSIFLGVNPTGELNVYEPGPTGRYGVGLFDARRGSYDGVQGLEATFDGCTCEGWGAADFSNGTSGWANTSFVGSGGVNLSLVGFTADATSATSVVDIFGASSLRVTHQYTPSSSVNLYQGVVTIQNIGTEAVGDLRYRRVMDWDIEPTPFNEYVTNNGTSHPNVWGSSDDGFASGDPLSGLSEITPGVANTDFVNIGPNDIGALFDFQFGGLGVGESRSFTIFYGAAATESEARSSLALVGAEVFSLAKSVYNLSGEEPDNSVFVFGFDILPNDGSSPAQALLGTPNEDGSRSFETVVQSGVTTWIDPFVAIGYDYLSDTAILTAEFEFLGDSEYQIYLLNDLDSPVFLSNFTPGLGNIFNFADFTNGEAVFGFRVLGIDEELMLDPSNLVAFRTGLTFDVTDPTTVQLTQTPITKWVDEPGSGGAVPEPATWTMMIMGFGMAGAAMRRRMKVSVSFA